MAAELTTFFYWVFFMRALPLAQNYFQFDEKAANWVTNFTQRQRKHFHADGSPLWCIFLDLSALFFHPNTSTSTTKWGQTSAEWPLPIMHKQTH